MKKHDTIIIHMLTVEYLNIQTCVIKSTSMHVLMNLCVCCAVLCVVFMNSLLYITIVKVFASTIDKRRHF